MAHIKAIPQKRSGRLLVAVRDHLLKQLKFESWLLMNHPDYFDADHCDTLKRRIVILDGRIKRAVDRELLKKQIPLIQ